MPRNMSFAMTTPQFKSREKDVTRRFGWWHAKAGDVYNGVEKAMGLKPGESIKRLGLIEVVSAVPEPLNRMILEPEYGLEEIKREGYPFGITDPQEFVERLAKYYNKPLEAPINRIEFKYLDGDFAGQLTMKG